jgi:hypothetical protein
MYSELTGWHYRFKRMEELADLLKSTCVSLPFVNSNKRTPNEYNLRPNQAPVGYCTQRSHRARRTRGPVYNVLRRTKRAGGEKSSYKLKGETEVSIFTSS